MRRLLNSTSRPMPQARRPPPTTTQRARVCVVCSIQGARSHVTALNTGKDDVEQMGSSVQTQVADMVDVDRTGELFIWLFQSLLKDRRQQGQQASQPRLEEQQGVKEGEGV
ncbi:hypothetical protein V8C86DRAFT_2490920 [Haematococcus lacustris]